MDSNIPSELTGPLPRKLRATGSGIYFALVSLTFLAIAVAGALWGAMNATQKTQYRAALRRDSSVTSGEITRMRKGKNFDVVYYTFTVNEASFIGNAEVPWQLRGSLRGSNQLPIRYLPANPDVNHPAAWEWSLLYWLPLSTDVIHLPDFSPELQWFFAPLLFGPVGIVFLMALRSERRLLTEGASAVGLVTKCSRGARGSYSLEYEFRTNDGSVTKGRSAGDRKEIGASLCILYLPQDPQRNRLYPSSNFRLMS
jgi:hypothetical protein